MNIPLSNRGGQYKHILNMFKQMKLTIIPEKVVATTISTTSKNDRDN